MSTKIEWCDETWNPITGCTPISEGCKHCYAGRMAKRLKGRYGYPEDDPFKPGTAHHDKFREPLHWKKPRRIFVCSMGDLFHEAVPYHLIDGVFQIIRACERHTFMVLTKRPDRMLEWADSTNARWDDLLGNLKNLWVGVTAENQKQADYRIPILLKIPAAIRFVSVEPILEPVAIPNGLDWVICGKETGPGARAMEIGWATSLYNQCVEAGIPFFFKNGHGLNQEFPNDKS